MNVVFLVEDSPFFDLFPRGAVPVKNLLLPNLVSLEGSAETQAYMLDVEKLTPEQFHAVAERLASLFQEEKWAVQRDMMLRGLPIRASQVRCVASDVPWFL